MMRREIVLMFRNCTKWMKFVQVQNPDLNLNKTSNTQAAIFLTTFFSYTRKDWVSTS